MQHRYGGAETLEVEEVGRPTAGIGEVLVRVHAAALNPTDYVVMRGFLRMQSGWRRPKQQVRGFDAAGTIEAVGAGVADLAVGDAVFGSCRGSLAEYAVGAADKIVRKPERLSFEQAAGIAVAGTMALNGLRDHAHLRDGQRVAITFSPLPFSSQPASSSASVTTISSSAGRVRNCANVANETQKAYTLVGADATNTMRVRVTATNADGSTSMQSAQTAAVAPATSSAAPRTPRAQPSRGRRRSARR